MAGNANSGRRPQSTALRVLRGNPSKTRLNSAEPTVKAADPSFDEPPRELTGDTAALAEWTRLAPMMRLCGLVSMSERTSLMALCQEWSRYVEAHGKVRQLGMIVKKGKNEIPVVNPYLMVSDRALANCLNLWRELGLTPSARSRLTALVVPDVQAMNRWEGLLP